MPAKLLRTLGVVLVTLVVQPTVAGPQDFQPRPIPMGVSISTTPSSPYIFAGTAGMRVYPFGYSSLKLILSNSHVMGAIGPTLCPGTAPLWTWILQPGTLDIGRDPGQDPTYAVGWLVKAFPINFSPSASNQIDAAIAITTPQLASNEILGIGLPVQGFEWPTPGMPITKSGRTTGVTRGTVQSVNVTVFVNYGTGCGTARFVNQIITDAALGAGGDSGSVVLNANTLVPIGLYFAGSPTQGVANNILAVYLNLKVFVDGVNVPTIATEDDIIALASQAEDPQVKALKPIQARHEKRIMAMPGVVGIGIGLMANGKDYGLVIYTKTGLTTRQRAALPSAVEGVPVRQVASGEFVAH